MSADRHPVATVVNGVSHERQVEARLLLSDFLRHELGLTGTHVGCEHGVCGACTVLVDGLPVRSCLMLAVQADGRSIETVEGLSSDRERLHPLQQAFRDAHALQCGFCTPGILMTVKAFLAENGAPSEHDVREALSGNLCRCTGYQHIVDAVLLAAPATKPSPLPPRAQTANGRYVGERITRNEDGRLLTGQALFVDDVELPGMLHAAFVRSPHAHARILGIDAAAARARAGVVAVYTAAELGDYWRPGPLLVPPPPIKDIVFNERTQVPLAKDKVRHVGEPVVMIVAESRYLAEDAAADIVVDYELLPAVVDLEAALQPGTATIHDDLAGNVAARVRQTNGNYAEAAKGAARIIRRRFFYDRGASSPIETRGVVAQWDAKGDRADHLGHHPGAGPHPQRHGGDARAERAAGARDRAVHRRRLRAEDHDVLPGGGADPVGRDAARPAGQVDRGPPREFLRHHPGARPDPRRRDRR